jgi:hypothetical protein
VVRSALGPHQAKTAPVKEKDAGLICLLLFFSLAAFDGLTGGCFAFVLDRRWIWNYGNVDKRADVWNCLLF